MATLSAARAQPAAVSPTAEPAPVPRGPIETLSVLLRFGAVMAVVLAAASLPASSLIGVRRVVVVGARTVSAADIVSRSGIRPGDRLLGISTSRAAARVRTLPRVARAEVSIGLGGAVTIHVKERRPYAAVALRGHYLLLDASGVVIDTVPAAGRLPVVAAERLRPAWLQMGDRLPEPRVLLAVKALGDLPREVLAPGVKIRPAATGELALVTPDGITVRLGPLRGLRERAALLPQLLTAVRKRGVPVEYLDLRFSGNVVMKPAAWPGAGERP